MELSIHRVTVAIAVLLLGVGAPLLAETPLEVRRHWSATSEVSRLDRLTEEQRREMLSRPPKATFIMRGWYDEAPKDGRWTAEGAVRAETIVLFDLNDGTKFAFYTERQFNTGTRNYRLVLWGEPTKKEEIAIRIEAPRIGRDGQSFSEEAKRLRERGQSPKDEDLLLTVTAAGRKWVLPVDEWVKGRISGEDRAWLDEAVLDRRTRELLEKIDVLTYSTADLSSACLLFTRPLLGGTEQQCTTVKTQLNLMQGKPDCSFDASFGEPCSLAQQKDFELRRNPTLVPD